MTKLSAAQVCVGEDVCTTDVVLGPVKRRVGATLENYCKPGGCSLYYTKTDSIPLEFRAAFAASVMLRERRLAGLLRPSDITSVFLQEVYLASERVRRRVQAEQHETNAPETTKVKPLDVAAAQANDPHKRFPFLHQA